MEDFKETINGVIESLRNFVAKQMETPPATEMVLFQNHDDVLAALSLSKALISHEKGVGMEHIKTVEHTEPENALRMYWTKLNHMVAFLDYVKLMVDSKQCNCHKVDVLFYKQMFHGFIFLLQHNLEKVLFSPEASMVCNTSDMKMVATYFDALCCLQTTTEHCHLNNISPVFVSSLLNFLKTLQGVVDADLLNDIEQSTNSEEQVSKLATLLSELSQVPSNTETKLFQSFWNKIEQLHDVCTLVMNALEKDDGKTGSSWSLLQVVQAQCKSNNYLNCIEDVFHVGLLCDMNPSNVSVINDTVSRYPKFDSTTVAFCVALSKALISIPDRKSKAFINGFLHNTKLLSLYINDDRIYFALVNFYENISGAVRVYVRVRGERGEGCESNESCKTNGIIQQFNERTITLETMGKQFTFGPFFDIVKLGSSNRDIIEGEPPSFDVSSLVSSLKSDDKTKNIVMFTYGNSGSGKTYTLFGKRNESNGLFHLIKGKLEKDGVSIEFTHAKKLYGYLDGEQMQGQTFDFDDVSERQFIENEVFQIGDEASVDAFVKTTPNNTASSRGFLIMVFNIVEKQSKTVLGKLGIVDMAGNENPYDILVRLLPTYNLPRKGVSSFLSNTDDISKSNIVFDIMKQNIYKTLVTLLDQIGYVFGVLNSMQLASDTRKIMIKDKVVKNFYLIYSQLEDGTGIETGNSAEYSKQVKKVFAKRNLAFVCDLLIQLWEIISKDPKFNLVGGTNVFASARHEIAKITKNANANAGIINCKLSNMNSNLSLSVSAKQPDNLSMIEFAFIHVDDEIQRLTKSKSPALERMLFDPSDYIESVGVKSLSIWRFKSLEHKTTFEQKKNDLISDLDNLAYEIFFKQVETSIADEDMRAVALLRYKWMYLIPLMIYADDSEDDIARDRKTKKESDTLLFERPIRVFPKILSDEITLPFAHSIFIDNDAVTFDGIGKLDELFVSYPTIGDVKRNAYSLWNKHAEPLTYLYDLKSLKTMADEYFETYFKSVEYIVEIENVPHTFTYDYLMRIVKEGFFINQANAELVDYLLNRMTNEQRKSNPNGKRKRACPPLDVSQLYFERYRPLQNLHDGCAVTGLTDLLEEEFESKNTKYVMFCNIRQETDLKNRLGAIETLTLVGNLKST